MFFSVIFLGLLVSNCLAGDDLPPLQEILNDQLCAVCEGEDSIDDCDHFTLCQPNQKCYLQVFREKHDGRMRDKIYGGCTPSCSDPRYFPSNPHRRGDALENILTENEGPQTVGHKDLQCDQCCTGDNCNAHLCNLTKSIESKLLCAVCDDESTIGNCQHFHLCNEGEQCYLQKFRDKHNKDTYYGGCSSQCSNHALFPGYHGTKRGDDGLITDNENQHNTVDGHHPTCGECCNTEACNIHLCGLKSEVVFCAACNGVGSVGECLGRHECPGQECYMEEYHVHGQTKVYAGCASKQDCGRMLHSGKRQTYVFGKNTDLNLHGGPPACGGCCHDGNHCNLQICANTTTTTKPTTVKLTSAQPQKITTVTNAQASTTTIASASNQASGSNQASMTTTKTSATNQASVSNQASTAPSTATPDIASSAATTASVNSGSSQTTTGQAVINTNGGPSQQQSTNSQPQSPNSQPQTSALPLTTVIQTQLPTIKCETCSGPMCGVIAGATTVCSADSVGCMNTVEVDGQGGVDITKKCGTAPECHTKWYLETSDNAQCMNFNILNIYNTAFTCHYCCSGDLCNTDIMPAHNSLLKS